jgi:GDP-L-fucose synthase
VKLAGARVLVTGGNGFLGTRVVAMLRDAGATVQAPRSSELDLLQRGAVRAFLDEHKPDLIGHLAARVGGIGANQKNPAAYFHDNLVMGVQLMDEAWRAGVHKLVAVGTVCAYPKFTEVPFREEAIWDGYPEETNAPYGLAKKMLLVQSQAYREQYGFNSSVLFPANLYGPRDNFDLHSSHVIPAIVRKIDSALRERLRTVTLWGDGSPTREFLYVDDCARAIVLACERYDASDAVNVGTGVEVSIRALATQIAAHMGYDGEIVWDASRPNGQPRRRLDVTRAKERFGFVAEVALDDGLRRTIAWWRAEERT